MISMMSLNQLFDNRDDSKLFDNDHNVAKIFSGMTFTSLKSLEDRGLMHDRELDMLEWSFSDRTSSSNKVPEDIARL